MVRTGQPDEPDRITELNRLGQEGWEMVAKEGVLFYFKREIEYSNPTAQNLRLMEEHYEGRNVV